MVRFHPTPAPFAVLQQQVHRAATLALALLAFVPTIAAAQTAMDVASSDVDLLEVLPVPADGQFEILHRSSAPSMIPVEMVDCSGPSSTANSANLLPHECAATKTIQKRSFWRCLFGMDGCEEPETCELVREFERTTTISVGVGGSGSTISETETMCDYGNCGEFNIAQARN